MRKLLAPVVVALAGSTAFANPPTIVVSGPLTRTGIVTKLPAVQVTMDLDRLVRLQSAPGCAYDVSAAPIAIVQLKRAAPELHIALHTDGPSNMSLARGFVVKQGRMIWTACVEQGSRDETATIGKIAEGWPAGNYEIYASSNRRGDEAVSAELTVFDPEYVSPEDAAAAPKGPLRLELGDDGTRPVSVAIQIPSGHPRWYPVTLTSTIKRKVIVAGLGDEHAGVGTEAYGQSRTLGARDLGRSEWSGTIKPGEPLSFQAYGDGGTTIYVVAADANATVQTGKDVFGRPAANATARQREVQYYTLIPDLELLGNFELSRETARVAGELFAELDPSLIMWVTDDEHCKGQVTVGEPVILLPFRRILHANGQGGECNWQEGDLSTKRPEKLALPKVVEPRSDQAVSPWHDEDFLVSAGSDKQIASYKELKLKTRACSDKLWQQLDPDGKADMYDVATIKGGKVAKIEGAGDRIFRRVYNACNLATLEKQRDAIYTRLSKTFAKEEQQRLAAIAKRFAGE